MTATLTLELVQDDTFEDLSQAQVMAARTSLETAIHQRIFGDGCMSGEILVDTWDLAIE